MQLHQALPGTVIEQGQQWLQGRHHVLRCPGLPKACLICLLHAVLILAISLSPLGSMLWFWQINACPNLDLHAPQKPEGECAKHERI